MNLQIENLTFKYRRKAPEVLSDVSLTFDTGEVVGLLGPNGAGKSTLLYLIAGALTPTRGKVDFDGISTRRRLPSVLSEIFLVAEESHLPKMTLTQYIEAYSKFYPRFDLKTMEEALKEFSMENTGKLDALSMGQKKKIILSFAFACNASVTLMDEPTNGLDIPGKAAFRRLVARMADEERLYIISTHQVRDLDSILDRVMIMNEHRFLFNETLPDIQRSFTFTNLNTPAPPDTLYSLPSIGGTDCMLPNDSDIETSVNLELLFGAVMQNPDLVNNAIKIHPNNS